MAKVKRTEYRKSSHKKPSFTQAIVFVTAILNLIRAIINLIKDNSK